VNLRLMLFWFFLLASLVSPARAAIRIADDMGGNLGDYLLRFSAIRDSGKEIMIDGKCFSACTLVTALVPQNRICITEQAILGFHAGWLEKAGQKVVSGAGTRVLLQMYPPIIRSWIDRQGGLDRRTIILEGRELAAIYRYCN
jgi:hypothetical protein